MLHILCHGHPYHFPIFRSFSPPKLSFSSQFPSSYSNINHSRNCRHSTIFASSLKKPPRAGRKVKSDADLRIDIREFLSTVGLPENHVPTMKELSNHGRQDLANIVRRRGYKFIRQLLETSSTENFSASSIDTGQTENLDVLSGSEGQNEKLEVLPVDVLSNVSHQEDNVHGCTGTDKELQLNDQSSVAVESGTSSLQEKVAKFIQLGELDTDEDSGYASTSEEHGDEGASAESEPTHEPEFAFVVSDGNVSSLTRRVEDPALENSISRNTYISADQQTSIGHEEDLDNEFGKHKLENQAEIEHLRFLLHRKELELTQLKEQIEKEKLALSILQTTAEKEIIKAQELISEKETELYDAEETLSGLKEVEIIYPGDGETVELAGSFNGWHHKIQMEPQLSSITDSAGSRISRLWRAVLWLYPGVYEIKFVINGVWRIDTERESISRNGVHNNILRVDR